MVPVFFLARAGRWRPSTKRPATLALATAALVTGPPASLAGQLHALPFETFAGSEVETYLRALQNTGKAAPYPWSLRALSPGEVEDLAVPDSLHPWASRLRLEGAGKGRARAGLSLRSWSLEYGVVRPRTSLVYNSAFPFGGNDGPIWAGRGLTSAVQAGAWARWGPLSLVVAPVAFHARNRNFDLAPTGREGDGAYRSPLTPNNVDLPQAFGPDPYGRVDAGNTTLRLDLPGVALGVSSAAQQWGPAQAHPLVLGPNAGGFPHVFVGTGRPLPIWIGRFHGRVFWGRLQQSDFAPESALDPRRLMTGLVLVLQPRGLPGLEVGITRFAHLEWPENLSLSDLRQPFNTIIGIRRTGGPDNELASAFFRWNAPGTGFEIFGEWVRIDGAVSTRIFMIEPDDLSGYAMGIRRVWDGGDHLTVARGEIFSTVSSHRLRDGARLEFARRARPMYQHSPLSQGHTHRGQLLASPAGHGGQGSTLGVDRYHPDGRWTVELERRLERDRTVGVTGDDPADTEVTWVLGTEVVRFRGPLEVLLGVRGTYNLNRHLGPDDRFNLNLRLGMTATF